MQISDVFVIAVIETTCHYFKIGDSSLPTQICVQSPVRYFLVET